MSFDAKSALPRPKALAWRQPVLDRAVDSGITLFSALPGYLSTDLLAGCLAQRAQAAVWLRLGAEDRDPGTLLVSLIHSTQGLDPELGKETLEKMARDPGPVSGWVRHFASLAREWSARFSGFSAPRPLALVVQHIETLQQTPGLLDLFGTHFLQLLPDSLAAILLSNQALPRHALPGQVIERGAADLRLDQRAAQVLAQSMAAPLSSKTIAHMLDLSGGRVEAILDLFEASQALGEDLAIKALDNAVSLDVWMTRLARSELSSLGMETLQALSICKRVGYSHPTLIQVALGDAFLPNGPWLQELSGAWSRIRSLWKTPLNQALRAGLVSEHNILHNAAEFLSSQGAFEQAIPIFFELGDLDSAGEAIASAAEDWMTHGQWKMLGDWLSELPMSIFEKQPWLLYYSGEIICSQGHFDTARKTFSTARSYFENVSDPEGICRSMLAENTLAAWHKDLEFAQNSAQKVLSIAQGSGMDQIACWACWQSGCLAVVTGSLESAIEYFAQAGAAARKAGDRSMIHLCQQAETLTQALYDLQEQNERYRLAYFETQRVSEETANQLRLLLSDPLHEMERSLDLTQRLPPPLLIRISAPEPADAQSFTPASKNLLTLLFSTLGMLRRKWALKENTVPLQANPRRAYSQPPADFQQPLALPGLSAPPPPSLPGETAPDGEDGDWEHPQQSEVSTPLRLSAHLMGSVKILINEQRIDQWSSNKCRAVFLYLLAHHHHPITRDVLMDVLWPEASLKAARNNLNVALYGLRRTLRTVTQANLIIYRGGAYSLDDQVEYWLDMDEFERQVQEGRQHEHNGRQELAVKAYEAAAGLYQGDFLLEDLYEEWTITIRQHLRLAYQEILDRLSQYYFLQEQFASCVSTCQILISYDNCREDIHCRLMRCYSRQGLDHLALRQYQACEEALRLELDVTPSVTTTQLYEKIHHHEPV